MRTIENFSKLFDNTNLKAFATKQDIKNLCLQSIEYDFKTVAINTVQCEYASKILCGMGVGITGVIGFPLGQTSIEDKVHEAKTCLKSPEVTDIDYVVNITELKDRNVEYVKKEMSELLKVAHEGKAILKVIFENAYLTDDEKKIMCEVANEVKIDFVKTSTGFATPKTGPIPTAFVGATLEDVRLMRELCDDNIQVKAAGGVNNLQDLFDFLDAGATRIGASSGAKIAKEYEMYLNGELQL
jgi:deoxyribose-phosphate aldolase